MTDINQVADSIVKAVQGYIVRGMARAIKRVEALEARPQAANGQDGAPGKDGRDGAPGHDGIDGAPGKGFDGKDGRDGDPGEPGQDGKSITLDEVRPVLEGEVAKWALEFERRAADVMQKAVDRLPAPKDGRDGFSLDDFDIQAKDGGRSLVFKLKTGDREVTREIRTASLVDRGVYKAGQAHDAGDAVTYGGSLWIAQADTTASPGGESRDWRLAVKRGRDGKDAAS